MIESEKVSKKISLNFSSVSLIISNCVPLFGVLFLGWNLFNILLLYWLESAVIGFFTILKMARVGGWTNIFMIPFFVFHFGAFMAGHFIFIAAFFGASHFGPNFELPVLQVLVNNSLGTTAFGLLSIFISHGISFLVNFIGKKEYLAGLQENQKTSQLVATTMESQAPPAAIPYILATNRFLRNPSLLAAQKYMLAPYRRIIIMQLTLIIGGFLILPFGTPVAGLIILVALKTLTDLYSHSREHSVLMRQPAQVLS